MVACLDGGRPRCARRRRETIGKSAVRRGGLPWATRSESKGGSNSVVESQPSKLLVAGSIPVSRSNLRSRLPNACVSYGWQVRRRVIHRSSGGQRDGLPPGAKADVAQLAERVLGKDEVTGSIPVIGSTRLGGFPASIVASHRGESQGRHVTTRAFQARRPDSPIGSGAII